MANATTPYLLTPLSLAIVIELQKRAVETPEASLLDLLATMAQERRPLPIDAARALATKLNDYQVLTTPPPGSANLFLGIAFPDGKLILAPKPLSLAKLQLALVSPLEDLAAGLGQAMGKQWDRIQASSMTQEAPGATPAPEVAPDTVEPLQSASDGQ